MPLILPPIAVVHRSASLYPDEGGNGNCTGDGSAILPCMHPTLIVGSARARAYVGLGATGPRDGRGSPALGRTSCRTEAALSVGSGEVAWVQQFVSATRHTHNRRIKTRELAHPPGPTTHSPTNVPRDPLLRSSRPGSLTTKPESSLHWVHSSGELWHSMMHGSLKLTRPAWRHQRQQRRAGEGPGGTTVRREPALLVLKGHRLDHQQPWSSGGGRSHAGRKTEGVGELQREADDGALMELLEGQSGAAVLALANARTTLYSLSSRPTFAGTSQTS